jgi:hypothetical protein
MLAPGLFCKWIITYGLYTHISLLHLLPIILKSIATPQSEINLCFIAFKHIAL